MKEELFNELIENTDIQQIRAQYHLSQKEFATLLGISQGTLQNWEQGRRSLQGPARILLQVAAKHPEAVWDVVQPEASKNKKVKKNT